MCFGKPKFRESGANKQLRYEGMRRIRFHQEEILPLIDDFQNRLQSDEYRGARDSIFTGRANVDTAVKEDEALRGLMEYAATTEAGLGSGKTMMGLSDLTSAHEGLRTQSILGADFGEDAAHADQAQGLLQSFAGQGSKLQQGLMTADARIGTATEMARTKRDHESRMALAKAIGQGAMTVAASGIAQYQGAANADVPTEALNQGGQMMRGWMGNADPLTDPGTKWGQRGAALRNYFYGNDRNRGGY